MCSASSSLGASIGYTIRISENLSVLRNPTNANVAALAAMQNQFQLMNARNMPFIELTNLSEQSDIVTLDMTIGDANFLFDFAKLVEASPGVALSVTQGDTVQNGVKTGMLKLAFTGLTPGKFVRFRTDIDSVVGNSLADYRQVMFDLNGGDDADNAEVSVMFTADGFKDTMLSGTLQEFAMASPTQLVTSCVTPLPSETVTAFSQTQMGEQEILEVPEPGSFVLGSLGGAGAVFAGFVRRRRVRRHAV